MNLLYLNIIGDYFKKDNKINKLVEKFFKYILYRKTFEKFFKYILYRKTFKPLAEPAGPGGPGMGPPAGHACRAYGPRGWTAVEWSRQGTPVEDW